MANFVWPLLQPEHYGIWSAWVPIEGNFLSLILLQVTKTILPEGRNDLHCSSPSPRVQEESEPVKIDSLVY